MHLDSVCGNPFDKHVFYFRGCARIERGVWPVLFHD